jgi:hypothetical protein
MSTNVISVRFYISPFDANRTCDYDVTYVWQKSMGLVLSFEQKKCFFNV